MTVIHLIFYSMRIIRNSYEILKNDQFFYDIMTDDDAMALNGN